MQSLIDILVAYNVLSEEKVTDTYTDLYKRIDDNTLFYNPSTEELSSYLLLRDGIEDECPVNFEISHLNMFIRMKINCIVDQFRHKA